MGENMTARRSKRVFREISPGLCVEDRVLDLVPEEIVVWVLEVSA